MESQDPGQALCYPKTFMNGNLNLNILLFMVQRSSLAGGDRYRRRDMDAAAGAEKSIGHLAAERSSIAGQEARK